MSLTCSFTNSTDTYVRTNSTDTYTKTQHGGGATTDGRQRRHKPRQVGGACKTPSVPDPEQDEDLQPHATPVYLSSWLSKDEAESSKLLRLALSHQKAGEIACAGLDNYIISVKNGDQASTDSGKAILRTLGRSITGFGDLIRTMAAPTFFTERLNMSRSVPAALEVFKLPEMLEIFVSHCETRDVLSMQQVIKDVYQIIEGSQQIQRQLGLLSDPNADLNLPIEAQARHASTFPGFSCFYKHVTATTVILMSSGLTSSLSSAQHSDEEVSVGVVASMQISGSGSMPQIGARCRAMLICQPPIKSMSICPSCCSNSPSRLSIQVEFVEEGNPSISSTSGLTVGDLRDAAVRLAAEHKLCPQAPESMLDEAGYVRVTTEFRGLLTLRREDPVLVAMREKTETLAAWDDAPTDWQMSLRAYTQAKRSAWVEGRDIPTLAEYQAEHTGAMAV